MPSVSKKQQRFMVMVHALQKGDISKKDVSPEVKKAAKTMNKKDAKDFASTKHKGLPNKVKKEVFEKVFDVLSRRGYWNAKIKKESINLLYNKLTESIERNDFLWLSRNLTENQRFYLTCYKLLTGKNFPYKDIAIMQENIKRILLTL